MKKAFFLLAFALTAVLTPADAGIPPLRPHHIFHQGDATQLDVRLCGNGRYAFYATSDGLALLRGADGRLYYARLAADGLTATDVVAHAPADRSAAERNFVATTAVTAEAATIHMDSLMPATPRLISRAPASTSDGLGKYGVSALGVVSSIGAPTIPVIMAEFADKTFLPTTTNEKLSRWLNEAGYKDEADCVGSVADYFAAQSDGLFTPHFKVVARVRLSQPYAYYGKDGTNGTTDLNRLKFVQEALNLAEAAGVNFTDYATDGAVPNVSIFYAGPGEHSSYEKGYEDYLWAHFAANRFTTANGVKVNSYFVGNELLQDYHKADGSVDYSDPEHNYPVPQSAKMDGIGVYCHEFSHALGLPDFYYTGNNTTIADTLQTMWYWSVMDYGQYVANGYAPIGYNAYERSFMGWLDVKDLDGAQAVSLPPIDATIQATKAYCVRKAGSTSDYYLLEYRRPGTWYPKRMGNGLLLTHINYYPGAWSGNSVNNDPALQRFAYVPADGEKGHNRFGDLFPTKAGRDSVLLYDRPVFDIAVGNEALTFSYLEKGLTGINFVPTTIITTNAVRRVFGPDGRFITTLAPGESTDRLPVGLYVVTDGRYSEKLIVK